MKVWRIRRFCRTGQSGNFWNSSEEIRMRQGGGAEERVGRVGESPGEETRFGAARAERVIVLAEANSAVPLKGDFERMARRRFQRGQLVLRGKRSPDWVGRYKMRQTTRKIRR